MDSKPPSSENTKKGLELADIKQAYMDTKASKFRCKDNLRPSIIEKIKEYEKDKGKEGVPGDIIAKWILEEKLINCTHKFNENPDITTLMNWIMNSEVELEPPCYMMLLP